MRPKPKRKQYRPIDVYHLPVTPASVKAVLNNPKVTYEDLDALYFSMCNSEMTGSHDLVEDVLRRMGDIAVEEAKG